MGHVFTPPRDRLVEHCRAVLGIETFIETGTYLGHSAAWAAARFAHVVTIEADARLLDQARADHGAANIEFVAGDSRRELARIANAIPGPRLFWLDAHYSGGLTAGADAASPLLDELAALSMTVSDDVILVDDFHTLALPMPAPFRADHAPSLAAVFGALRAFRPPRAVFAWCNMLVIACGRQMSPVTAFLRADITRRYERALAGGATDGPWYGWMP